MNSDFSDFIRFFPIFRLFPTFRLLDSTALSTTPKTYQNIQKGDQNSDSVSQKIFWRFFDPC